MRRLARWLIPLATVVGVALLDLAHAELYPHYPATALHNVAWLSVFALLAVLCTYAAGIPDEVERAGEALLRAVISLSVAAGLVSVLALVAGQPLLPRSVVLGSVAGLTPTLALVSTLVRSADRRRAEEERVVAICNSEDAQMLAGDLSRRPERPAVLVATVDVAGLPRRLSSNGLISDVVTSNRATLVVLGRDAQVSEAIVEEVTALHRSGVRVRTMSRFYEQWLGKLPVGELEQISLLFDINELHRRGYQRVKRYVDVAVAVPGLLLCAVATPFVALLDLVGNRGPLLYRQQRVGKNGKTFVVYKFRTMPATTTDSSWTEPNDPRIGRVASFLRRSHLDELPQFLNVLRRDLSIVGPRPEQPRYVAALADKIPYYDVRHLVRPGITGWAQVKYAYGSSELDAFEKLQYEFYYLAHQSIGLDLRIVGRTLRSVAGRRGR